MSNVNNYNQKVEYKETLVIKGSWVFRSKNLNIILILMFK